MKEPIFSIRKLNSYYVVKGKKFHAVRDVTFDIFPGETVGLVGESGCGKTTLGKLLLGLLPNSSGEILYEGMPIKTMEKSTLLELRKTCQMIFQDPYGSVNPRMTVEEIITEPLVIYKLGDKKERKKRAFELLNLVGLDKSFALRYPHELSGGQRQRVVIARALAPKPKFIICDEPIAALDVSIQAQIINLLKDLQRKLGLTYLFISHDLAVVKYLATRTMVMYCGKIVETADSEDLYKTPLHPYTETLLHSIPIPDPLLEKKRSKLIVSGEPPNPFEEIKGCPFASRCPKKLDYCSNCKPNLLEVEDNHFASCHLYDRPDRKEEEEEEKIKAELQYSGYYL